MTRNSALYCFGGRRVFYRNLSCELEALRFKYMGSSGIYLIGWSEEIVYVGQSYHMRHRSIDSLERIYFRVPA
jgi:hypothetical protein